MVGTYHRLGVHIWASDVTVIRAARLKIAKRHRRGRAARAARHAFYREILAIHRRARALAVSGSL